MPIWTTHLPHSCEGQEETNKRKKAGGPQPRVSTGQPRKLKAVPSHWSWGLTQGNCSNHRMACHPAHHCHTACQVSSVWSPMSSSLLVLLQPLMERWSLLQSCVVSM